MVGVPASTAKLTFGTMTRQTTTITDAKGRGLMSFLRAPGNPADLMLDTHSLRLAALRTFTMTAPAPTPKTQAMTAALS